MVLITTATAVVAISLRDGSEQWQQQLTPAIISSDVRNREEPVSPVIADGRAFVSTVDSVIAFELKDGSVVWETTGVSGTGIPAVAGNQVIVPTERSIQAFDIEDGRQQWVADVNATMPAVSADTVVVSGEQTVAIHSATGEQRWTYQEQSHGYPVVTDGTVFLGTRDGIVGLSVTDGTEQWRIDRGRFGPPVVTPESVYAAEQPGEAGDATFAFDRIDGGSPDPRWCSQVGEGAVTAATDDAVFASQSDGVTAFTERFGEAAWLYPLDTPAVPPAILDGAVVSVSPDGVVVGIGGE